MIIEERLIKTKDTIDEIVNKYILLNEKKYTFIIASKDANIQYYKVPGPEWRPTFGELLIINKKGEECNVTIIDDVNLESFDTGYYYYKDGDKFFLCNVAGSICDVYANIVYDNRDKRYALTKYFTPLTENISIDSKVSKLMLYNITVLETIVKGYIYTGKITPSYARTMIANKLDVSSRSTITDATTRRLELSSKEYKECVINLIDNPNIDSELCKLLITRANKPIDKDYVNENLKKIITLIKNVC